MAQRMRPDVRLLIGLALVLASVAGMVGIVGALDRRVAVYAAPGALLPGEVVTADDLVERMVTLDGAEASYLRAGAIPPEGVVVARPVAAGELLATAAVGSADGIRATALVLPLAGPVSATIGPGSLVDVWASAASTSAASAEAALPPIVLVGDATVVRVVEADGFVADGAVEVEVLVPRTRIARVLQAIADGSALALVPAGLPVSG